MPFVRSDCTSPWTRAGGTLRCLIRDDTEAGEAVMNLDLRRFGATSKLDGQDEASTLADEYAGVSSNRSSMWIRAGDTLQRLIRGDAEAEEPTMNLDMRRFGATSKLDGRDEASPSAKMDGWMRRGEFEPVVYRMTMSHCGRMSRDGWRVRFRASLGSIPSGDFSEPGKPAMNLDRRRFGAMSKLDGRDEAYPTAKDGDGLRQASV
ncbi:hypothetical protein DFP72DRAFT_549882 [Ephemerocybe angulata]|uniref:Uncharacterized protein n=1 Tax=Ephemerocybe angulata TaxID=980116 RepID=A0A8H6M262_9AGAR|nr:hypothetical protein DFP72DRAFT_549882 [Tulosesus angulatus]